MSESLPNLKALKEHAERELDIAGIVESDDDPINAKGNSWMRRHILSMVREFESAEHSHGSAQAAIEILSVLLTMRPLTPLNGTEDEWEDLGSMFADGLKYRNKRCSRVRKMSDGRVVDTEGKVFWEWVYNHNNEKYQSYYTNKDSWVDVTFPYLPSTEYIEKDSYENKLAKMPFTEFKDSIEGQ